MCRTCSQYIPQYTTYTTEHRIMLLNRPAAFRENETEIREAWKLLMKRDNLFTSLENTSAFAR